jgi:transposase
VLRGMGLGDVPEETALLARTVFPGGCLAMRVRDDLGPVLLDSDFAALYAARGRPAVSPARLAVVSLLQFVEGLTDRQAAHAVKARLDWKYALGLELSDTGFNFSVLSDFRARLAGADAGQAVFDALLEAAHQAGLLSRRGHQRTDSTHVLAAARDLSRLEFVIETLRAALNSVAGAAGTWLAKFAPAEWFGRYSARPEDTRYPTRWAARIAQGDQVGADGTQLLQAVTGANAPDHVRALPAVEILRQVWVQQFQVTDDGVRWREMKDTPPGSLRLRTPYDTEARPGVKRETVWGGYKAHLTETCDAHAPHLITNVLTTPAPVPDIAVTEDIHASLARRDLLPEVHLVDAGYIDAEQVYLAQRDHRLELLGPLARDTTRGRTEGVNFDNTHFTVDWENRRATCPGGRTSTKWSETVSHRGTPVTRLKFAARDCVSCSVRQQCTDSVHGRSLTLRPRAEHEILQRIRPQQDTRQWWERYHQRAGIEGTVAQAAHSLGMRRSRYRGLAKTHLHHIFTSAAINLIRIDAWLSGRPLAPTRTTPFAALRPAG